ncbi:MAG TPA: DUF2950 domain-containing protein [Casimicrobiaceae bacterium]
MTGVADDMHKELHMHSLRFERLLVSMLLGAVVFAADTAFATGIAVAAVPSPHARPAPAPTYATPQIAVDALVAAVRASDLGAMLRILGPGSRKLVESGDAVADAQGRTRFIAAYDAHAEIEEGEGKATLLIGEKDWPFPVPLTKSARGWSFDSVSGAREFLDRRIGRNELSAIQVCLAYVDAQREYAATAGADGGVHQYARKFSSSAGQRDGLYWRTADGAKSSPLGPLVAKAQAEGYDKQPYHGYYYRILLAQGPGADSGAYDYIVKGRMIGGFALIAYPAGWGSSGVMTFIVNQDGVVYEKNLGPRTSALATAIHRFDPDATWRKAGL